MISIPLRRIITLSIVTLWASVSTPLAHELWIDAEEYQVAPGAELRAHLRNGQNFEGIDLAWFAKRQEFFDRVRNGRREALEGRAGDVPAVQAQAGKDGLVVLAYQSRPAVLTYEEWEKFRAFTEHKDLGDAASMQAARDLPREGFKEVYTRFSKALIGVGSAEGTDVALGLETEFVALSNPYLPGFAGPFEVRLLFRGMPRKDAQVEIFDRAPDGTVEITYTRTDGDGRAEIPVRPGHEYLLDAVILREPVPELAEVSGAVWESLWAALTFGVPE